MKDLFKNFIFFIALALLFSSQLACPTANTQKGPTDGANSGANTPDDKKKDSSTYPPLPSAIAQTEIKLLDGKTFKLEEHKGKVVMFNLWGIWCGPCIAEMPHLIETQEKYREQGFEIVGLNVGDQDGNVESEEAIKAFAEKHKLNYQLGYADRKLFDQFISVAKMAGVPISVLVNRDGKMTGIFQGGGPRVISQMKETVGKTINE